MNLTDGEPIQVVFILDDSGSMSGQKMGQAKAAAQVALTSINNRQTQFGLIDFNGCEPRQLVNFTDSRRPLRAAIAAMGGRDSTPIAESLRTAYEMINQSPASRQRAFIILFTDGAETCRGDPCAVVEQYRDQMDVPVYAIGYMIGAEGENQLRCVAEKSGGAYFNAPTEETVQETFRDLTEQLNRPCSADDDCQGNYVCQQGVCRPGKVHLVYVPVNMEADEPFRQEAERQHQFLVSSLPSLGNCTSLVKMTALDSKCDIRAGSDQLSLALQVGECVDNQTENHGYDFFIGIVPSTGLFDDATSGYTFGGLGGAIVRKGWEVVTAHEIGHQFGLNDEYCKGAPCNQAPNPLSSEYGCDPDGGCCWKDGDFRPRLWPPRLFASCSYPYEQDCCEGNLNERGGRSIMSWSDADGPRYHDVPSLAHLANNSRLRCD
ncbi:MAG: VWA domain-containing protein [Candidatus Micrarchaeota archaeon]